MLRNNGSHNRHSPVDYGSPSPPETFDRVVTDAGDQITTDAGDPVIIDPVYS